MKNTTRLDKAPGHRAEYQRNRARILATQDTCGICGKPVDKSLKFPHPLSPTVDHIIPLNKGGHPSDIDNLQLAHRCCNRAKSDKLTVQNETKTNNIVSNRVLPQSFDWSCKPPKPVASGK